MGALSVTVHEVVHVACQKFNDSIVKDVMHLGQEPYGSWFGFNVIVWHLLSWLCDLFKLICSSDTDSRTEGETGGYPIPQHRKKNWKIPECRVQTRRNNRILWLVTFYLKLYPSREFATSSMYAPEINFRHREKTWKDLELIGRTIEKPGHYH